MTGQYLCPRRRCRGGYVYGVNSAQRYVRFVAAVVEVPAPSIRQLTSPSRELVANSAVSMLWDDWYHVIKQEEGDGFPRIVLFMGMDMYVLVIYLPYPFLFTFATVLFQPSAAAMGKNVVSTRRRHVVRIW